MKRATLAFLSWGIVLAATAQTFATVQDPVKVEQGQLAGAVGKNTGIKVYRGIPYAAPPVGNLRWKAPQAAASWRGVRQATQFGNPCIQTEFPAGSIYASKLPTVSEDCLYLNIWTPAKTAGDELPVMFWIHGGGFTRGRGSAPPYDGEQLALKGVVVVTINYRLGIFGFLSLPELTAESSHHASGNYGLMDQIAALEWVKKNISAFGGDRNKITIFGESAGSWAVNVLTASPLARGLFVGAIGESGGEFAPLMKLRDAERAGQAVAAKLGATQDVLRTLRAKPADEIIRATGEIKEVIVDGWVLPMDVWTIFSDGKQNDVPTILGNNADEATTLTPPSAANMSAEQFVADVKHRYGRMADQFLRAYPANTNAEAVKAFYDSFRDEYFGWDMRTWARLQTKTGRRPAYRYYFSRKPSGPQGERLGAFHGIDLEYVFGNFTFPFPWDDADRKLSDLVVSYWTNFAKTGAPNGAGLPAWPAYDPAEDNSIELGNNVSVRTHVNQAGLDFFDAYHPVQTLFHPSRAAAQ